MRSLPSCVRVIVADIQWLEQAREDLLKLLDFIAGENPRAAVDYVQDLQLACGKLAEFPSSGRRYNETFRVLVFRNHLIFYSYEEASRLVSIVTVLDGRRDIARLLDALPGPASE